MLRWFCLWGTNPLSLAYARQLSLSGEVASRSDDGEGLLPQNPMKKYTQIA